MPQRGNSGVRPLPASLASRYFLMSSRNRSPNATCVKPPAPASPKTERLLASYCSLLHGHGSGTVHRGNPAASACASSSLRRTACIATRSASSFIVVTNPPTSIDGSCLSTCSIHALSFPELHDTNVFVRFTTFYFLLSTFHFPLSIFRRPPDGGLPPRAGPRRRSAAQGSSCRRRGADKSVCCA